MKRLASFSIFIFWAITASVLTAGLVFFQKDQNVQTKSDVSVLGKSQAAEKDSGSSATEKILNAAEVAKHNSGKDCWMIVSGKVYNFTSYLPSHPGGPGTITPYCGKDGTSAFSAKPHSQYAWSLLSPYYVGDLNSKVAVSSTPSKTQSSLPTTKPVQYIPPAVAVAPPTSTSAPPAQSAQSSGIALTASEVAKHSSTGDCWMIVSGKVYNVTSYVGAHPGGTGSIAAYCGQDATSAFYDQGHSQNAANILGSYYIGDLNSQTSAPPSGSSAQPNIPPTQTPSQNQPTSIPRNEDDDDD